jgi:glycosyltransferase involved in cell wall biosynthesis
MVCPHPGEIAVTSPKVSILIPTYNRPDLLTEALASVAAQDFDDFEVIVRDDAGRPDEVEDVIRRTGDERIVYRRNHRNRGVLHTNVRLYSEARGQYLAHLDDDDGWRPHFLSRMVGALEGNPDCGVAFANHLVVDEHGTFLPEKTRRGNTVWGRAGLTTGRHADGRRLAAVARAIPLSHSAVVRAATLDIARFAMSKASRAWDFHIAALSVRRTGWLWFDSEPLSIYRWGHGDQMSNRPADDSTFEGLVWVLRELAADPDFAMERPKLLRQLAKQEAHWSLHSLVREKRIGSAVRHVTRASQDFVVSFDPARRNGVSIFKGMKEHEAYE